MLGNELPSDRSPEWPDSCAPICVYSSARLEPGEPKPSRSIAREAALKRVGVQGGHSFGLVDCPELNFLKASSGLLCNVTNLENTCLISSVLSTQFTKWAASDVARTPRVGCEACSPRLAPRCFFLPVAPDVVLLNPFDGTQQQPLPDLDWLVAGKLRCSRSECSRLHSARHLKWAGDGWKIQTGMRKKLGPALFPAPSPRS
mmetsp:Transcript_82548/g.229020  ORF Transcript_82548/g.229020 Transcript_82548/m.229020 type:complete len:202 (+) Transcript_82548:440-1045(+)